MATLETSTFPLNDGTHLPAIGIGCWMGEPGKHKETEEMLTTALECGYRSIDTAAGYGNEEAVGHAVRTFKGCSREEIYITTKLKNRDHHRVREAFEESFAALNVGYIDQYLIHWPQAETPDGSRTLRPEEFPTIIDTWRQMEDLLISERPENGGKGRLKSIGVSNFSQAKLEQLFRNGVRVVPATNQIELHPSLPRQDLIDYCQMTDILPTAYTPLGGSRVFSPFHTHPFFTGLAKKHNITTGQLLLSWTVQRGTPTFPMSSNPERIKQNIQTIRLPEEDMKAIDGFHKQPGHHRTLAFFGKPGFFGWSWEDLEFECDQKGYVKGSMNIVELPLSEYEYVS